MRYAITPSPLGDIAVVWSQAGLRHTWFCQTDGATPPPSSWQRVAQPAYSAGAQLAEYFAGRRTAFDLPLDPRGTPFQLRVWAALRDIPYGATASYGQVASRLGQPGAARAVGGANNRNPLPIVVPCHRVIGADGALVGYGGGLHVKEYLLQLERGVAASSSGRR